MADPFGILGLTGTVEQLVKITSHLINSHKALKENSPAAQSLLATYQELESLLTSVSPDSFRAAKPSHVKMVKHELDTVMRIFTSSLEEVQAKTTDSRNWASQYLSALKDKERIKELEADAEKIRGCIFKLSSDENINWRLSNMSQGGKEKCRPGIYAKRNLRSVIIDLDAKDENGQPSTCESKLKQAILRDGAETHACAVAMGQGGVGKTCTLRAIAYDDDVTKNFPGVYLLSLGMDATVGTIIQQLCMAVKASGGAKLASKLQMEDNLADVVAEVQDWFKEDASLFIIDDVWVRNGIDAKVLHTLSTLAGNVCGEGSRRSRILYSTRDPELFKFGETVTFKARDSRGERALEILLNVSGESCDAYDDAECQVHIEAILDKCAGLPLALNIAGSAVRLMRERWRGEKRGAWKKYSEMMNKGDVFENEDRSDVYAYGSVYKMLESSIKVLDLTMSNEEKQMQKKSMSFQEMHRALCVMKKQDWVPCCILEHLWETKDGATAERALEHLESVGAAELQYEDGMVGVRLHDLTQEFAKREAKKHDEKKKWHRKLLDKYRTNDCLIAHSSLSCFDEKEKQYVFENVYRICEEAGHYKELQEFFQSARWVSSVVQNGTLWVMEQAVQDMIDEVAGDDETMAKDKPWLDEESKFGLRKIVQAARLSVPHLNGSVSNVFFQLYARLLDVSEKSGVAKRLLEDVERCAPRPWLKTIRSHFDDTDVLLEEIDAGCCVTRLKFSSDGIAGCGFVPPSPELWVFKHDRRTGVNVMTWDVNLASDGAVATESEDASTGTAEVREGEGARIVQNSSRLRDMKKALDGLGVIVKSVWCCFQRDDDIEENGEIIFSNDDGDDEEKEEISCSNDEDEDEENKMFTCSDVCEDLVATGYSNGRILIWILSTKAIERRIKAHRTEVSSICFSADGRRVVSGSFDGTVRVWEVATGEPVCDALTGHTDAVRSVAMSADGRRVVSGSDDRMVRAWEVRTGAPVCEALKGHMGWVTSVALSAEGSRVVSGSWDKTVRVWDVGTGAPACEALTGHSRNVTSVAISADGRRIVSGSWDKTVRVWDVGTGAPVCKALTGHTHEVRSVAISADGRRVMSGSADNTVLVWEVGTGAPVREALTGHTQEVRSVAISADGRCVASGSEDKTVRVWEAATGAPMCEALTRHTDEVTIVTMSVDGRRVVSGSADNTVRVWEVATGAPACEALSGHTDEVTSVAMSADGSLVVSGSWDKTVRVWKVETGAPVCDALTGHTDTVWSVAMSADGRRVVSGSTDNTVLVWEVGTGAPVCEALTGHTEGVASVAISADGRRVVSSSDDNTVRLWNVVTRDCLFVTEGYQWDETVGRYCGDIADCSERIQEEGDHYSVDGNAVKYRCANKKEEILAQFGIGFSSLMPSQIDINSRKGVVAVGNTNGRVGIFKIIK